MAASMHLLLAGAAMACAAGAGACGWGCLQGWLRRASHRRILREGEGGPSDAEAGGLGERLIALAQEQTRRLEGQRGARQPPMPRERALAFERRLACAGLQGTILPAGLRRARLMAAGAAAAIGAVAGCVLSAELAVLLAAAGAALGWAALPRALRNRAAERSQELERHLPEMLDVVAMGMRSGLSFDRSLGLYVRYFHTLLAQGLGHAQQQWEHGLARRDDALRALARTYDSPIFGRVVESIVRSLHFGSSLSSSLEALAAEARVSYRTRRQEQVAKAPIKVMVPTGTLILPAMLILVLGPVLLELMGEF